MGIQSVICALSYAIILSAHIKGRQVWSFPLFTFFIVVSIPYQIGYGTGQRLGLDLAMCGLRFAVSMEAIWVLIRLHFWRERLWFCATVCTGILFAISPGIDAQMTALTARHLFTTAACVALFLATCYDRIRPFTAAPYARIHIWLLLAWELLRVAQTWLYRTYQSDTINGLDRWTAARWWYVAGLVALALAFLGTTPRESPSRITESMEGEKG